MKLTTIFGLMVIALSTACSKSSSSMSPIQAAACDVESVATGSVAAAVATAFNCQNQPQIQTDLQTALGNVNFCAASVPAPASLIAGAKMVSKLGDVTKADIDAAKKAKGLAVKPMGIVGNIACPIILNAGVAYLTQAVPSSWSCTASSSAQTVAQALTIACEAAIPL